MLSLDMSNWNSSDAGVGSPVFVACKMEQKRDGGGKKSLLSRNPVEDPKYNWYFLYKTYQEAFYCESSDILHILCYMFLWLLFVNVLQLIEFPMYNFT